MIPSVLEPEFYRISVLRKMPPVQFQNWNRRASPDPSASQEWRTPCQRTLYRTPLPHHPSKTLIDRSGGIVEIAHRLAPKLAERAAEIDQNDRFVGENYALLKEAGLVEAGVPRALGGGGAEIPELAEMLRVLAHACGSTALAFSMHTHQVAIPAWRWHHQKVAAVEPLLKRVAAERLILLSSGGSDWIGGSGKAEKVEGGYRVTARKVFTSGAEAGNILMTGAIHEGEDGNRSVIHFGVPMKSPKCASRTPGARSECAAPPRTTS